MERIFFHVIVVTNSVIAHAVEIFGPFAFVPFALILQ